MVVGEVDTAVFQCEEAQEHACELQVLDGDGAGWIVGGHKGSAYVFGPLDLPQKRRDGMRATAPDAPRPEFTCIGVSNDSGRLLDQLENGGGMTGEVLYKHTPIYQRLL